METERENRPEVPDPGISDPNADDHWMEGMEMPQQESPPKDADGAAGIPDVELGAEGLGE